MASADFLAHRNLIYSKISPGLAPPKRLCEGAVRTFSFLQFLRHLHINPLKTVLGVTMMCLLTPNQYASYAVSVRQYRILQSGFLQCIPHEKPLHFFIRKKCGLLTVRGVTPIRKGLSPIGRQRLVAYASKLQRRSTDGDASGNL